MATTKQRKLAQLIVENSQLDKPLNSTEMLVNVGYKENTAKHKQKDIIEAEGVKEALKEAGFTEDRAKFVVAEILITGEEQNRLKAADMVFKHYGSYAAERHINVIVEVAPSEELVQYSDALLTGQKAS